MNPVLGNNFGQNFGQFMSQFKGLFKMIQAAQNPQAMFNQMLSNNPQAKEIMDYVGKYNGNYQQAFLDKAKEMGIDPNEFLNSFK